MLTVLTRKDFTAYIALAYDLVLDPTMAGYPVYYDGIKTREDFIRRAESAFSYPDEEVLLFFGENRDFGWIHYFCLPEDKYIGFVSCGIRNNKDKALDEFLSYVEKKYPGCNICLGFPEENREAITALLKHNFQVSEELWNNVLDLSDYPSDRICPDIVCISKGNFKLFSGLHAEFDEEVFRHLLHAVIMACETNKCKHLVFFGDDRDQPCIMSAGFRCVGKYILLTQKR